ncbi:MAG TPA: hypothetical protein VHR66_32945 [Gemmataceae bacterium]|jgi:hypothetical protein|nr:hypothetical protein [Gemmataceae bacterium]
MSTAIAPPLISDAKSTAWRANARWALLIIGAVGFIYCGFEFVQVYRSYARLEGPFVLGTVAYTDQVKAAVTQKLDSSKSLLTGSLVVFGVLWGLILAKKGEGKLVVSDLPEMMLFLFANTSFAVSWYCQSEYVDAVAAVHAQAGLTYVDAKEQEIFDFRDSRIDDYSRWQFNLAFAAVLYTGAALASAHILKESPTGASTPS